MITVINPVAIISVLISVIYDSSLESFSILGGRESMEKELRILILEDVPVDAELMERELRKGGIIFSSKRG